MTISQRVAARYQKHYRINRSEINAKLRRLNSPAAQKAEREYHGGYGKVSFQIVPISEINVPAVWHPGRLSAVKEAIQKGEALPPIQLSKTGSQWEISDGIHRTNASLEMGFTHIPAYITEWVETPEEEIPEEPEKEKLSLGAWVKLKKPERGHGKPYEFGYIEDDLGYRMTRGVRRYWYGVGLVRPESTWPDTHDLADTDFEPTSPPSWGQAVKDRIDRK